MTKISLEGFIDNLDKAIDGIESDELNSYEQGVLYAIARMFPRDRIFRKYIMRMVKLLADAEAAGRTTEFLIDCLEFSQQQEKKCTGQTHLRNSSLQ